MRKIIDKNGNLKKNVAWAHREVEKLEMINIGFAFANMCSLIAINGYFEKCDFSGAVLYSAVLNLTQFDESELRGSDLNCVSMKAGTFASSRIKNTTFINADLRATEFIECDIVATDFRLANLAGARFHFRSDQALREFLDNNLFEGATLNGCMVNDIEILTLLNK